MALLSGQESLGVLVDNPSNALAGQSSLLVLYEVPASSHAQAGQSSLLVLCDIPTVSANASAFFLMF